MSVWTILFSRTYSCRRISVPIGYRYNVSLVCLFCLTPVLSVYGVAYDRVSVVAFSNRIAKRPLLSRVPCPGVRSFLGIGRVSNRFDQSMTFPVISCLPCFMYLHNICLFLKSCYHTLEWVTNKLWVIEIGMHLKQLPHRDKSVSFWAGARHSL